MNVGSKAASVVHIIFDLDNTLSDEFGKAPRPGIQEYLQKWKDEGHRLSLWTSSTKRRAVTILNDHDLRKYFGTIIFREDYDPDHTGAVKDIRRIDGDILVDDDPEQINFINSIGKKGFLIKPYRPDGHVEPGELQELDKFIRRFSGPLRWLPFKRIKS